MTLGSSSTVSVNYDAEISRRLSVLCRKRFRLSLTQQSQSLQQVPSASFPITLSVEVRFERAPTLSSGTLGVKMLG